jgi:hypothetical protein
MSRKQMLSFAGLVLFVAAWAIALLYLVHALALR